ncbi:MAG: bifunctional glutamate N-acetyltransferase/amino-acid acetyltransferase ArgJ [Gemmatimonadota bacterium]
MSGTGAAPDPGLAHPGANGSAGAAREPTSHAARAVGLEAGNATSPASFFASGVHCGIKRKRPDLALLVSEGAATVAAMFTTNRLQAAPVLYSREVAARGTARAVVVNSGNANACTGEAGLADVREMARLTARELGVEPEEVLVASTGIIGVPLPMEAIREGIPAAARTLGREGETAARAILTTDAFPKTAAARFEAGARSFTVGGMAKGAGMIHPNLATTLAFLTTDAPVQAGPLREVLRRAVDVSFHAITVDGDTSTNDAVLLLANGAAGGAPLASAPELAALEVAVTRVARELAKMVVRDGEGATRVAELQVRGAASGREAHAAAMHVANSLLVKTALYGGEPNWGRILAAAGAAGVELREERIGLRIGEVEVVRGGLGVPGAWEAAAEELRRDEVHFDLDLGIGTGEAAVWTCDIGPEYVRINGSYAT